MPTLAQAISDLTTLRILSTEQALKLLKPSKDGVTEEEILDGSDEQHHTDEYARAVEFLKLNREEGREDTEWNEIREAVEKVAEARRRAK